MEFGVVLDAVGRAPFQFLNKQRMTIRPFGIARFWHFVVWQTILQCAFTKLGKISQSRQDDIGSDAVQLGRAAGDSIKLLDRQFELANVFLSPTITARP